MLLRETIVMLLATLPLTTTTKNVSCVLQAARCFGYFKYDVCSMAKHAVLVAHHDYGFTLWPTVAVEPGGDTCGFAIAHSSYKKVVGEFVSSMQVCTRVCMLHVGTHVPLHLLTPSPLALTPPPPNT